MQIRRWKKNPEPPNTYFVDQDRLLADIAGLAPGTLLIMTVHPVYYGCRHSPFRGPTLRRHQLNIVVNKTLGWQTYKPLEIQCYRGNDSGCDRQSVNFSNELGMLDNSFDADLKNADLRILLLGGDMLDAPQIAVEAQCQAVLEKLLAQYLKNKKPVVRKLAFKGMGISRLWSWYEAIEGKFKPHVVLLGIDGFALRDNLPVVWQIRTGFSAQHPPGDYLAWNRKKQRVEKFRRSETWAIHQMKPREIFHEPYFDKDLVEAMMEPNRSGSSDKHSPALVQALYDYAVNLIRRKNTAPLLFIEELGSLRQNGQARLPIKPVSEAGMKMRSALAAIAGALDVQIIDPYHAFEKERRDLAPTDPAGSWNYTGHRLAAEAMFDILVKQPVVSALKETGQK